MATTLAANTNDGLDTDIVQMTIALIGSGYSILQRQEEMPLDMNGKPGPVQIFYYRMPVCPELFKKVYNELCVTFVQKAGIIQ